MKTQDWKVKLKSEVEANTLSEATEAATKKKYPIEIRVRTGASELEKIEYLPGIICVDEGQMLRFLKYWEFRNSIDSAYIRHRKEPIA